MANIKTISEAYLKMKSEDILTEEMSSEKVKQHIEKFKKEVKKAEIAMNEFIKLGKIADTTYKTLDDIRYKVSPEDRKSIDGLWKTEEYRVFDKFNNSNKIS